MDPSHLRKDFKRVLQCSLLLVSLPPVTKAVCVPTHRSPYILFGRDKSVADLLCAHPSISKQHAVLQFRSVSKPDDFGIDQVSDRDLRLL